MIKAIIELEFENTESITAESIVEYIQTLVENNQLYIEFYDDKQTPLIFGV